MVFIRKYLAGVSGGSDSMALLNMYRRRIVGVCHVNYHKRKTADRDEKIVEKFCLRYHIPFFCLKANAVHDAFTDEKNFQTRARKIRYDFYEKCAKKTQCNNLLLGHTLDDSIETAYDQLERRVVTLFYGIKKKTKYRSLTVYRPLIHTRKSALIRYCHHREIVYGTDETNQTDLYRRNMIRKLINAWSPEKFLNFYREISSKNDALKKTRLIVKQNYKKWIHQHYSQKFILNLPLNIRLFVLHKFLVDHEINCRSAAKLKLIENFIAKNVQPKTLRLQKHLFLQIKRNCLSLVAR